MAEGEAGTTAAATLPGLRQDNNDREALPMSLTETRKAFSREEQVRLKKLALVTEACRIFNERGFGNASLDDIASSLSITKAALYYYFKSKQEILFECYMLSFAKADEAMDYAEAEGRTGREKLEFYVRRYVATGLDELAPTISLRESEALDGKLRRKVDERRIQFRNRLRGIVREGVADGSITDCDPALVVTCIAGIISWLFRVYDPRGKLSPTEMADGIVSLLANGFVPRDGASGGRKRG
jgi:AcrR family transcriptional regulator